ncbi:MAG: hypothetical protein K6A43_01910 [Treponema sp.]|nr:hypothetical protein [Treponema sp.]
MKKLFFGLISAGLLLLSSCNNLLDNKEQEKVPEKETLTQKASFSFDVNLNQDAASRALITNATPFGEDEISSVVLSVESIDEEGVKKVVDLKELGFEDTWETLDAFKAAKFELKTGIYNFSLVLNAKSIISTDEKGEFYEYPVQTAVIENKELVAGQNNLVFNAKYAESGEFVLNLYNNSDTDGKFAEEFALASLTKWPTGEAVVLNGESFENFDLGFYDSDPDENGTIQRIYTFTRKLPVGKYQILIKFYDEKLENSNQGKNLIKTVQKIFSVNGYYTKLEDFVELNSVVREGTKKITVNYNYENFVAGDYGTIDVETFDFVRSSTQSDDDFKMGIENHVDNTMCPNYMYENAESLYGFELGKIEAKSLSVVDVYFNRLRSSLSFYKEKEDEEPFYQTSGLFGADFEYGKFEAPTKEGYELTGWDVYCYSEEDAEEPEEPVEIEVDISKSAFAAYTTYPKVVFIAKWANAAVKFKLEMESITIDENDYNLSAEVDEENASVIFTAPENFDSYTWYFDATKQKSTQNTLTISSTSSKAGVFQIVCVVVKDETSYQLEGTVTIIYDGSSNGSGVSIEIVQEDIPQIVASGELPEPEISADSYSFTVPDGIVLDKTGKSPKSESYEWLLSGYKLSVESDTDKTLVIKSDEIDTGVNTLICKVSAELEDGSTFTCILSRQFTKEQ